MILKVSYPLGDKLTSPVSVGAVLTKKRCWLKINSLMSGVIVSIKVAKNVHSRNEFVSIVYIISQLLKILLSITARLAQ